MSSTTSTLGLHLLLLRLQDVRSKSLVDKLERKTTAAARHGVVDVYFYSLHATICSSSSWLAGWLALSDGCENIHQARRIAYCRLNWLGTPLKYHNNNNNIRRNCLSTKTSKPSDDITDGATPTTSRDNYSSRS